MRWNLRTADSAKVQALAEILRSQPELHLSDPQVAATVSRLLVMRGIDEPEAALRFLTPSLDHLHSPYLLTGMKTALDRLEPPSSAKKAS